MADPVMRKLARQLVGVEKRLHDLEMVPQLAHSSIDDSALPVYDAEGTVVARIGKQADGTWGAPPLSGPTPPTPLGVSAVGGPGAVTVSWTGEFETGAAPLDFDTLEVLVDGSLAGAIPNRDGGSVTLTVLEGTRYISARIRTLVPRHSSTTSPFAVEVGPAPDALFAEAQERIAEARERIEAAEGSLTQTGERLDAAEQTIEGVRGDLTTLETVTLPGTVADLEAADQAAQEQFTELGTRLDTFGDDPALESMRQALSDAQATAASASQAAAAADQAASAASQAALEAAGIAASKGRTIIQETEPQGEDRNAANIWIKPSVDDPDTDITETATTYVYIADTDTWVPTTSDELAQAAQNALDAREAAQQAQQRADTAISNAAIAQGAAEAAQRTANQATTDAREAHNEAVAAQGDATEALEKYGPLDQRTIDAQAAADAAQKRADEAYVEAASKLDESQVDAKITASANGKNSITVSTSEPSGNGVVNGDTWWRIDGSSNIFGQWVWDGSSWVARQVRSEVIANLDVHKLQVTGTAKIADAVIDKLFTETFVAHKITGSELSIASVKPDGSLADDSVSAVTIKDGAITAPKITFTEELSGNVARFMSVSAKEAVITGGLTANAATLIGQTVVDDINVQGKLVGKDGVFTGTVDFENINVSGQVLADRLSGWHIYGTIIEGSLIQTSDGLPGKVILWDEGFVDPESQNKSPGIRIVPPNMSEFVTPPGMGPNGNGFIITGGLNTTGGYGSTFYGPHETTMNFVRGDARANVSVTSQTAWLSTEDGNGNKGRVQARPEYGAVEGTGADGAKSFIQASPSSARVVTMDPAGNYMGQLQANGREVYMRSTDSGGTGRILSVDTYGVWAKTNESGSWENISLVPQVRKFQYSALWNADQSPAHIMVQHLPGGKLCQAQIRIQNRSGSALALPYDTWVLLNYNPIPSDLRGGYTDYIEVTLPQLNARGRVEMNYSTGRIRIKNLERDSNGNGLTLDWHNNSSIWFPMRWFSPD